MMSHKMMFYVSVFFSSQNCDPGSIMIHAVAAAAVRVSAQADWEELC